MSGSLSTVWSMVKSGAISIAPPMLATPMMASTSQIALLSSQKCRRNMASLRRLEGGTRRRHGDWLLIDGAQALRRRRGAHGHPDIVGADHRAEQEQQPADGPRDIVGMHRNQRVDEGVG